MSSSSPSAPTPRRFPLDETLVEAFQADGAVVLRGLLGAGELELLEKGIDENLARPSPRAKVASTPDDPGFFVEDFCCWQENEAYRRVIFESALGEVGARLMRSTTARLFHDHMLTKEPGTRRARRGTRISLTTTSAVGRTAASGFRSML